MSKALDDLDGAISQQETVESCFARAKVHEAQNKSKKGTKDFRPASQLTARLVRRSRGKLNQTKSSGACEMPGLRWQRTARYLAPNAQSARRAKAVPALPNACHVWDLKSCAPGC
jgi:hypothetical protein